MNCVEMIVTSPVPEYFYNIEKLSEDKKAIAEPITEKILDDIEKHEKELEMMDAHLCGDEDCDEKEEKDHGEKEEGTVV